MRLLLVYPEFMLKSRWDALGQSETVKLEDDTAPAEEPEEDEGRVWRVQAHARSAISCMKVDPINGSSVSP